MSGTGDRRVAPAYEVVRDGEARTIRLPFVVGVLTDRAASFAGSRPPLAERRFATVRDEDLGDEDRGLCHLMDMAGAADDVTVRVLSVSKAELAGSFRNHTGEYWEELLFRLVYEKEYGQFGGEPYGLLVADYEFDQSEDDVRLLSDLSRIAAAAHAPLFAGAAPALLGIRSWADLEGMRYVREPEAEAWREFRAGPDARYVGLAAPRFRPADLGGSGGGSPWVNGAFAFAGNAVRAFRQHGWCAAMRGALFGGMLEGVNTEASATERQEPELARAGVNVLVQVKNEDAAVFFGASSVQRPPDYDGTEETSAAIQAGRFSYLLPCCRFVHFIKCIARDRCGCFRTREEMESFLNDWLAGYVGEDPAGTAVEDLPRRPFAKAGLRLEEDQPGIYLAKIALLPRYQLQGLNVPIRLETRLPAARG